MIETGLYDVLNSYLDNTYIKELADEIRASLMVFEAFQHEEVYEEIADFLYDPDSEDLARSSLALQDLIHRHLNKIFAAHQVEINENTPLEVKNNIAGVFYRLQFVEDPMPLIRILETDYTDEEKIVTIISYFTPVPLPTLHDAIANIAPSTITTLASNLEMLVARSEEEIKDHSEVDHLLENLKDFFTLFGEENLAHRMIESGVTIGHEAKLYYPYFKDEFLDSSVELTAKNILSFLFIARDTYKDPLTVFRTVSEDIIPHDAPYRPAAVENVLLRLTSELSQYQKAKNEAHRVSSV